MRSARKSARTDIVESSVLVRGNAMPCRCRFVLVVHLTWISAGLRKRGDVK
jgi:hypothetical protein